MKKTSYFDQQLKNYGENWIVALTPEDIQRSAKRIVKDMVRGNIDYEKHGKYFLDTKFLDNIMIAINNEYEVSSLHYNALVFYQQYFPQIPNLSIHINHDAVMTTIYRTILNKLEQVKLYQNVGFMCDTAAMLNKYKQHLI